MFSGKVPGYLTMNSRYDKDSIHDPLVTVSSRAALFLDGKTRVCTVMAALLYLASILSLNEFANPKHLNPQ